MTRAATVIGFGTLFAAGAGISLWMTLRDRKPILAEPQTGVAPVENRYLGDETCARCHPGEAFRHARSGHARTLVPTGESAAARSLDEKSFRDEERGVTFHYRWSEKGLTATAAEKLGDDQFPLDWAFGSGEHAITFLTLVPNRAGQTVGIEHRVSLWGPDHRPGLTPHHGGLKAMQDVEQFGRVIRDQKLEACVGCHTTATDNDGGTIMNRQANVGCERCHGAGSRHIQAAVEKRNDLEILFGKGNRRAAEQVRLCGECHRHPETLSETSVSTDNPRLARFQPVGLLQSTCFRKSAGEMSCTTCHDPHEHVARQRGEFDSRCLTCHAIDGSRSPVCPQSPRENCVACHMPEVEVRAGTKFHDHWIRVRNEHESPHDRTP
jgi:hypothetical protein